MYVIKISPIKLWNTACVMEAVASVYTLLIKTIHLSQSTKVASGTVFRKHTEQKDKRLWNLHICLRTTLSIFEVKLYLWAFFKIMNWLYKAWFCISCVLFIPCRCVFWGGPEFLRAVVNPPSPSPPDFQKGICCKEK